MTATSINIVLFTSIFFFPLNRTAECVSKCQLFYLNINTIFMFTSPVWSHGLIYPLVQQTRKRVSRNLKPLWVRCPTMAHHLWFTIKTMTLMKNKTWTKRAAWRSAASRKLLIQSISLQSTQIVYTDTNCSEKQPAFLFNWMQTTLQQETLGLFLSCSE